MVFHKNPLTNFLNEQNVHLLLLFYGLISPSYQVQTYLEAKTTKKQQGRKMVI
jgi:hypothetical protein